VGLRIEVLGPLRIVGGGGATLQRPAQRRLLSILALEAPRRIGSERLIDLHWGEHPPAQAKASLQTHISALRRIITPGAIATEGYGYRLDLDVVDLDAVGFAEAAAEARRAADDNDWSRALESASAALDMWRDAPYPDLADDLFARPAIVRLEETHLALWETWGEALLRMSREAEALPELERLVVEYPLRERLWGHLMTARYRLGRHAEATRAYREMEAHLAEMGLEPSPTLRRLEERILLHHGDLTAIPHNLPGALTTFIGRDAELADIDGLLTRHRLVTLTGVGGSGKTRLALQAASAALESFPDGCWLVELADLRDGDQIAFEVANAIGLQPTGDALAAVTAAVKDDTRLVVLDNCEHLLEGAAAVAEALATSGPGVRVVATSREPLHVAGEAVYEVPTLEVPPEDAPPARLAAFDTMRLFADRAALVEPSFAVDGTNASVIARICRRLDGIPLAIELAAAKVRGFSLDVIEERLAQRFELLTGGAATGTPRHRTLEAAIAWSHDLLDEDAQHVLARLSVFRGGFDLTMAERVAADDAVPAHRVMAALYRLVEKSLASRDPSDPRRYRLLETLREYARGRLGDGDEATAARRRHLEWCVDFAGWIRERIYGAGRDELLARLQAESDNLQAALELAESEPDPSAASIVADALAWHWAQTGDLTRCRAAIHTALDSVGADLRREAELRSRLARVSFSLNDVETALAQAARAHQIMATQQPSVEKAAVLGRVARLYLLLVDQDPRRALPIAREAREVAAALGDPIAAARAAIDLGAVLTWNGEIDEGLDVLRHALELTDRLRDPVTTLEAFASTFDPSYLHPTERRDGPRRIVAEVLERFSLDDPLVARYMHLGWFPYVYMQSGEWDLAEEANLRLRRQRREGYDHIWYLMAHGTLRWMQGRLDEADTAMAELAEAGVNPRWYHDYYPLRADIAADRGDLAAVRAFAAEYLATDVDPSEEAKKLGVLDPLARAEVDAALGSSGPEREGHLERVRLAVDRMQRILDEFPHPTEGSLTMETHGTHLALARAELSRGTGPDPDLWRAAADRTDFMYFRLYARLRLAEALSQTGHWADARQEAAAVLADATRIGAEGLRRAAGALSARIGTDRG
jgi:predicted ATPase/DNA-binding SARP family transcriptional activator